MRSVAVSAPAGEMRASAGRRCDTCAPRPIAALRSPSAAASGGLSCSNARLRPRSGAPAWPVCPASRSRRAVSSTSRISAGDRLCTDHRLR